MKNNFSNLSDFELENINGGMAPAALYALGFVLNTNPLTATVACGGLIVVSAGAAIIGIKNKKK